MRIVVVTLSVLFALPSGSWGEGLRLSGQLRLDCTAGQVEAHVQVCNDLKHRITVSTSLSGGGEANLLSEKALLDKGRCIDYSVPVPDPLSTSISAHAALAPGFFARQPATTSLPLGSLLHSREIGANSGELGVCTAGEAALQKVLDAARRESLTWHPILAADSLTCGCLDVPIGLEDLAFSRLAALVPDIQSSAVKAPPREILPVIQLAGLNTDSTLTCEQVRAHLDSLRGTSYYGQPDEWERHWGERELTLPERINLSLGNYEHCFSSSYLLSVDETASKDLFRTQKIDDSTVQAAISSFFRSYYSQYDPSLLPGPLFTTIEAGWLRDSIMTGQGHWERIRFRVGFKVDPHRIVVGIVADGWYNSGAPTTVGEVYMVPPSPGERELRLYTKAVLDKLLRSIEDNGL